MKTVVIASGKGGTGKTTLTALFALEASRSHTVVVADADVEASNLPIALNVIDSVCEAFPGGSTARIDEPACFACGRCAEACRFEAVSRVPADGSAAYRVDPWACEGCGACAGVCAIGAITMEPSTAGEACTGQALTGPIAFGQLGPGEDLSGRLVTEVRQKASARAEETRADLLLIDGPPGIGCPVIAAVTNADLLLAVTEPTRSGAHDLERLVDLAGRFDLPVLVALNKADLSETGARTVRALCAERGLELVAEIPFDASLSHVLPTLAQGDAVVRASAGIEAAGRLWSAVSARLARGSD